jgi:stage V sporulation protein SpoVS
MHNIGPDIADQEVGSFAIRSTVRAIACPEGAVITDKDGAQLASYPDKCHVVIDGDQRFIVADYVFAGLYAETDAAQATVTTSADVQAQHDTAATLSGQPVAPTHDDLVDGLRELDGDKRAAIRAALDDIDGVKDNPDAAPTSSTTPGFTSAGGGTDSAAAAPSDAGTTGDGSASQGNDAATTTPGQ